MPEGDTVFRAAARLDAALGGAVLTRGELNVPRFATADLAGAQMLEVVPRGKHLLMRMRHDGVALTLHSHLRMDGSWLLVPTARGGLTVPEHEVRAVVASQEWTAVGRLLGEVDLVPTAEESSVVGHLGPDLLATDFDQSEAIDRLMRDPDAEIANALREQRNVAGLGNELVNEVLFLRGVGPWTPVGSVALEPLVSLARRVIRANSTRSIRSTTGDLRPGRTSYVYNRTGKPCRRCRTPIAVHAQGAAPIARSSWWCPRCQPGPAPS